MSPDQIQNLQSILTQATTAIHEMTGLEGIVHFVAKGKTDEENVRNLFSELCAIWNMSFNDVFVKSRKRNLACMRMICWMACRSNFPDFTVTKISNMSDRDHSTVVVGIRKARHFYQIQDVMFMSFINPVKNLINVN